MGGELVACFGGFDYYFIVENYIGLPVRLDMGDFGV